jgi:outer membrane immunogenic protein
MKRIFATAMLLIVGTAGAMAADLPQPMPPPPQAPAMYVPAVAPVYNWGGIYLGINGGYGFGNSNWTGGAASSGTFTTNGFVAGGTLGFNYQWDALVVGAETDLDFTGITGNGPPAFCTDCKTSNDWLGTTRGRVGWAVDRMLFYGTAGVAYGNIQANANGITNTSTEIGWTAGLGVEAAITDNLTARLEYLYVDLSSGSCTTACGAPPFAAQSVSFDQNLIRAGLDFKFR